MADKMQQLKQFVDSFSKKPKQEQQQILDQLLQINRAKQIKRISENISKEDLAKLVFHLHDQLKVLNTALDKGKLKGERGFDGKDGRDGKDGEKGDKGDRGEKGERGERGERGEKGERGLDGIPGAPGKDAEITEQLIQEIKELVSSEIEPLELYENPEMREEIEEIEKDIEELEKAIEELRKRPVGTGGGVTDMRIRQAFKYILKTEAPVGDIDGVNLSYTVSQPIFALVGFSVNGETIAQLPNYTISDKTITFTTALDGDFSGKDIEVKYI